MGHQAIETDIAAVGYGSAGAAAPITAHDHGGGNSRLSAARLISAVGPGAVQHVAK